MKPYYERDGITIFHGDCLEILPTLERVDHVITDPPYESEAHTEGRRIKTVGGGGNYGTTGSCVLDFDPMTAHLRSAVSAHIGRLVKRWVLVFCQVEAVVTWRDELIDSGLSYRRTCAWIKSDAQPQLSGDRPGMGYESIVCAHARGRSTWNGGGKRGVYETARASTIEGRPALHMTEKPMPHMVALISDFTNPGDLILDCFGGSGTTAAAAKKLGRRCVLIEREERHCATAATRIAATDLDERYVRLPNRRGKQGAFDMGVTG
jgi:DNA modification methylase